MKKVLIVLFVLMVSVTAFAAPKLTIGGGYNINTATVDDANTSGGLSLQAKMLFDADKDLFWGFQVGYITFMTGPSDLSQTAIPVLGMLQMNFSNDGSFALFGNVGFGAYFITTSNSFTSVSTEELGVEAGLGFEYMVSPTVGLGAELQMHYILASGSKPQFTLLAGVTFHL